MLLAFSFYKISNEKSKKYMVSKSRYRKFLNDTQPYTNAKCTIFQNSLS